MSKVYYCKNINSESLVKVFTALNVELKGNVGIKMSTGEMGSKGYLKPDLIRDLVKLVNGTIIECNTAYSGKRNNKEDHLETCKCHGLDEFKIDILDGEEDMKIPCEGKHLKYNLVGRNLDNYDSFINLSHGKGHAMGGFGASLKNQSIGFASRNGKAYIHSAGRVNDANILWDNIPLRQEDFIESMAEAAKSICDYCKNNNKDIVYITVMNNISLDCDCDSNQGSSVISDKGIIASIDPISNDQAFIDFVFNSNEKGTKDIIERIDSRCGRHILDYGERIGIGSRNYELIEIE